MKKALLVFILAIILCLMFVFTINAEQAYLEEIPSEWLYSKDTVTHFIVFNGNEYFNDATTLNSLATGVMDASLSNVKIDRYSNETVSISTSEIGVIYLTKFVFPGTTTDGKAVTNVNLNAMKSNGTYFWGKVGSIVLPSSATATSDMNQAVGNLRHIDFGENSQLKNIPGYLANSAEKLSCVENFPKDLDSIGSNAFNKCKYAFKGVLYINATTIGASAFNNATTGLTGLIFGPKLKSIGNQSICSRANETGLGEPKLKFIEFQCSVSALSLQAIGNDVGSFNFAPKSGNPRSPYSSLKCIVISHPDDLALLNSGKSTIQELNSNIYFDEQGDNPIITSHKVGQRVDAPIYESYYETGYVRHACPDCGKEELTPFAPFFECLGYSRTEGNGLEPSITVGFKTDRAALNKYIDFTKNSVEIGAIVVGAGELNFAPLDENGNINEQASATVIKVPIKVNDYFDCKIVGFSPEQFDNKLMLGAYIIERNGENVVSIAYMQKSQVENGNYEFISYNSLNG